jgi:hypothetical protein
MEDTPAEIRCDEYGFAVIQARAESPVALLNWSAVKIILAYKRDVFAHDLICLAFEPSDGTIEVNEEMHGWSQLVEALPSVLPGTPPFSDWWGRVAQPPFVTCATTLFQQL